ncbi:hypothetical protein DFH08DRAFT_858690 [Mycena albidolilacea]|uniref:Uncharacterized protein n=1 Tax=Mycena albidolilacea TaxID=1033008 RepID=A0AAD7A8W8_9AGAR|nr:hypothetical protein DFH08DRAFT_858690 [Mycena albidolilacea]
MSVLPTSIDCHVPAPSAAAIHLERTSSVHSTTNPVDDFFGYSLTSSRTRDSRHDRRISVAESLAPPPYMDAPEYTEHAREPVTLAMYLFKFGFLFPPFWIFGIFILLSPLRAPPAATPSAAWLPEKTDAERQVIINRMRTAELKWAKRCLYALVILLVVAAVISVAVWAVLRS